jgi:hypothetical protein
MKQFLLAYSFFALVFTARAQQPLQNNLLSRYGVGSIINPLPTGIQTMGGAGAAFRDAYQINPQNPASLGFMEQVGFEIGLFGNTNNQNYASQTLRSNSGNIREIMLALPSRNPYTNKNERVKHSDMFTTAFALQPLADKGYNVETNFDYPGNDSASVNTILKGSGGLYRASWMNAYRYQQFSAGITLSYDFGTTQKYRENYFDNLPNAFREVYRDNLSLGGLNMNIGLMYDFKLKGKGYDVNDANTIDHLVVGAWFKPQYKLKGQASNFYYRASTDFNLVDTFVNTLEAPTRFESVMPGSFGIGLMYEKTNKLRILGGFRSESWSNYSSPYEDYKFADEWQAQAGIEYIPEWNSYNSLLRRIRYRGGVEYGANRYQLDGTQGSTLRLTTGVGFPVKLARKQISFINLGLEYTALDAVETKQNIFQFNLGFQLNDDSWFYKRKYE